MHPLSSHDLAVLGLQFGLFDLCWGGEGGRLEYCFLGGGGRRMLGGFCS